MSLVTPHPSRFVGYSPARNSVRGKSTQRERLFVEAAPLQVYIPTYQVLIIISAS